MQIQLNKNLAKQILFTVAYYNVLGYYPTSFFVWKNLINIKSNNNYSFSKCELWEVLKVLEILKINKKIIDRNGMYGVVGSRKLDVENQMSNIEYQREKTVVKNQDWYKIQIQKNKISVDKIKRVKRWAKISKWVPYLRGIFLTGTLAMKRGGVSSDWDVLVILKEGRIWIGRFLITMWFHIVKKRRYNKKITDRFCLNQFVVNSKLEFGEHNEFFGNELIMAVDLMGAVKLKKEIIQKNEKWIKIFKPNIKLKNMENDIFNRSSVALITIQKQLENILESFNIAKVLNDIFKKSMIKKIINNPKTYFSEADIRYGDFFLIFLPRPQRTKVIKKTFDMLTKINL